MSLCKRLGQSARQKATLARNKSRIPWKSKAAPKTPDFDAWDRFYRPSEPKKGQSR